MQIDARPSGFGATLSGVAIGPVLSGTEIAEIRAALDRYGVVIFHDQFFSDAEQLGFAERFGQIEFISNRRSRLDSPGMMDVSNLNATGDVFARDDEQHLSSLANQLWHTDSSFSATPACYSMLSCREATMSGGDTQFADLRAAYDALEPETKILVGDLVAEHMFMHSRRVLGYEGAPPNAETLLAVPRPVVHEHAASGRMSLYLASHAFRIRGWPVPEGRLLLAELTEHATQPAFVYRHSWRNGDFVLWDNRCTMHRGLRYPNGQRRDLRRTTTNSDVESLIVADRIAIEV